MTSLEAPGGGPTTDAGFGGAAMDEVPLDAAAGAFPSAQNLAAAGLITTFGGVCAKLKASVGDAEMTLLIGGGGGGGILTGAVGVSEDPTGSDC